ncbi:MAG: PAS domain S-box protein [Candidatus Sabulitectum sp.]|nr:PAS domain S-box protein [Candidatus Sabulitectum sp.]
MSTIESNSRISEGKSVYELLMHNLSEAGICALVTISETDRIIKINKLFCDVLRKKPSDLLRDTAENVLKELIETGISVNTQLAEMNGVAYKVFSFKKPESDNDTEDNEYRRRINDMDDIYVKVSADGKILDITPSVFEFSGFSRDEVLGTSLIDYFSDPVQRDELLFKLGQEGKIRCFVIDLLSKDGETFSARGSMHVVLDDAGIPACYEGILSDISEEQKFAKELLKQNIFFRKVVESVPDAVVSIDTEGLITGWNKEAVKLFGWTVEEAIGQPVDNLVSTGTEEYKISSEAVIGGEIIRGLECTRRGKNLAEKKVSVSVAPIIVDGESQGAVGVYTDLSDRDSILELLRENEIKFRTITESAQDAVIIIDAYSCVSFFNSAAELMFGYRRSETIGKELHKLIAPEEYWEMIEMGLSQFRNTGQGMMIGRVVETEGVRKNGTVFPVELSVSSFFLNDSWHATGILRDISERKRIELELIEAREGALNATRTKSEFLANMSHEIRTPLNAIIGTNDLLWNTDLTSAQKSYLRVSRNASDNLLSLINDILDISKVEAGKIELEEIPFNLYEDIEKTCETLALRAHEKVLELNCRIHPDTPRWVMGDPSRLKQVITNLIGNSIKFTDKGEITVEVKPFDEDKVKFSVTDTGIGIPEGKVEAIFMSFTQADSSHTRRYGGTGLGLAISTRLVELMGGEISVKSEVNSGSSFSFFCDLPETDLMDINDRSLPPDISGRSVLVADDNRGNRMILKELLEGWGAVVDLADCGAPALRMLGDRKYDTILLDYMMPDMDGSEVVDYMRRDQISTDSVIMMLTCDDSNSLIEKCRLSGIDRFLFKPVRRAELSKQIHGVISGVASEAESDKLSPDTETSIEKMHLSVLLAEDSPDNRFLIIKYAEAFPWEITIAENGQEALDLYLQKKFDLILMDMQMPVMDGYEATRSIRAHESISMGGHTPIVALTAHALREEVKRCLDAGCDVHISKPVRKKNLVKQLDELLKIMGPREGFPELATDVQEGRIEKIEPPEDTAESPDNYPRGPIACVPNDLEPLISGYLKNRRGDVVNIRQHVHDGDYAEAQRLAHSMKGSGGGYGFDKITQLGAAMEIAAKSQDGVNILSGIDELEIYLDTVRIEYVDEE